MDDRGGQMTEHAASQRDDLVRGPEESAILGLAADYVAMQRDAERETERSETAAERGRKVHAAWTSACEERVRSGDLQDLFEMGQVSLGAREGANSVAKRGDLRLLRGASEFLVEVQSSGEGPHKAAQKQAQDLYLAEVASGPVSFYAVTAHQGGSPSLTVKTPGRRPRDLSAHLILRLAARGRR
jgi:uncharacterized membrane-anchored protein